MQTPEKLFILPFDHQTGLWKAFGWLEPITPEQISLMHTTRMITYQGYLHGLTLGIPQPETAILTDDVYGAQVLVQAKKDNVPVIYTLEKSGQPSLVFQHDDWQERILEQKPDWIKTLVRFNPTAPAADLALSLENLKKVSDFAHEHQIPYMIEPLVQPTEEQKDIADFDHNLRHDLTITMIHTIYQAGISPTVWKIEGSDIPSFYTRVAEAIQTYDDQSRIVVLGRNETLEKVISWIQAGIQEQKVIGFAVGRTVFLEALKKFLSGDFTSEEAIHEIGERYYRLYCAFEGK
jgi:5-dehydro-2-deoxygluconokinase